MRILLFGKNGQVGWELSRSLQPLGEVIALGRDEADFSEPESLRQIVQDVSPGVIVNAAAYTAVDKAEEEEEKSHSFKRLKNKHSAIESNINELEHRGLDRCPDRGIHNYKRYISLGVCAYNLKKIGRKILAQQRAASTEAQDLPAQAA